MWRRALSSQRDQAVDSNIDSAWLTQTLGPAQVTHKRPPVDRARIILIFGLVGAALLVLWLRWLAGSPHLPVNWQVDSGGSLVLESSTEPALQTAIGHRLLAIQLEEGQRIEAHPGWLQRSARWITSDSERAALQATHQLSALALRQQQVKLWLQPDLAIAVYPRPRGFAGLGLGTWAMSLLALLLYLGCSMVLPSLPSASARFFGLVALAQCIHVLLVAAELMPGMGLPSALARADLSLRLVADMSLAVTVLHLVLKYPHRHTWVQRLLVPIWCLALAAVLQSLLLPLPGQWWWIQGAILCTWAASTALLQHWSRGHDKPLGQAWLNLLRLGTGSLLLLSLVATLINPSGSASTLAGGSGISVLWQMCIISLLMLLFFKGRTQPFVREYAVMVCVAVGATSLNLLLLVAFPLRAWLALCLALMASLVIYLTAKPWVLSLMMGNGPLRAVRMFEQLYRVARALEQAPQHVDQHLARLLSDMFDPLEVAHASRSVAHVRLAMDGTALVVPIPSPANIDDTHIGRGSLILRFARRGQRLFTQQDKQLTERMLEQLRRAAAYDRALEQGRSEERSRLAQDLHDDIGARLLTLMYKAPNSEVEEYIRHTLQDLKTLTRGLAASSHPLSHSAAEWKADIHQRLQAAGCQLHWTFNADRDIKLSVAQWSGLTRILRELINNIITHARATQVHLLVQLEQELLTLRVQDDGQGVQPHLWSHGLGLGGVRKRTKLLEGTAVWTAREPRGIQCEVQIPLITESD
jgi:signal transduction histidine kinase